jgi:hypothetical protein
MAPIHEISVASSANELNSTVGPLPTLSLNSHFQEDVTMVQNCSIAKRKSYHYIVKGLHAE